MVNAGSLILQTRKPMNSFNNTNLRFFENVVAQITDAVIITNARPIDGKGPEIIYVNEAFTTITGYTKEEVLGKTPRLLAGPETKRESLDHIRRALENWQPSRTELLNYKKNGEIFWIELEIVPIKDEKGWVTNWVAIQRDITLRKAMQKKTLSDTLAPLTMTFDAVAEGVDVRDGMGWIVECNHSAEKIFGLEKAQLRGTLGSDLWATAVRENGSPLLEDDFPFHKCRRLGEPVEGFVLGLKIDGSTFKWLSYNSVPLKDETGKVTMVVSSFTDVTERKKAEADLIFQKHLLRASHDAMIALDLQGVVSFWNPAAEELYGWKSTEALGKNITNLIFELQYLKHTPEIMEKVRSGACWVGDFQIKQRSGKALTVHTTYSPIQDSEGRLTGILGTSFDISERISMEEALRKSESQMKALIEATPDSIIFKDGDGRFLLINRAAAELFLLTDINYSGKTDADLAELVPARKEEFLYCIKSDALVWQARQMQRMEEIIKSDDGNLHYIDVIKIPLFNPDGSRHGLVVIGRNVTESRLLEAQLRQAQKMEAVGQLAGGLAHDFNNILAAILLGLEYMSSTERSEDKASVSHDIKLMIEHATTLTSQLLMFSRKNAKKPEQVELNSVIRDLMKMLGRLIGPQIQIIEPHGADAFWVEADKTMLNQAIMNVCINARDVMPKGGILSIELNTASNLPASKIELYKSSGKNFVCLTIRDTGTGMNDNTLRRIFEPFFTTKEVGKGTGLGLAVVHGIVEQHEGWIEVESTVGKGSAFHLYFPTVAPAHQLVQRNQQEEIPAQNSVTVLYVEDLDSLRKITAKRLRNLGYDVLEAADAEQALVLWGKHHHEIKLLLTDVVMPGSMSGLDLAKQLRKKSSNLGLVVVSGYTVEMLDFEGQGVEGLLFLPKPYEFAVLVKSINQALAQVPRK